MLIFKILIKATVFTNKTREITDLLDPLGKITFLTKKGTLGDILSVLQCY